MNWYSIFYWITVADSVKSVTGIVSIILGVYFLCSIGAALGMFENETFSKWDKGNKRVFYIFNTFFFINLLIWTFIPTKKDALMIVAGGAVGQFITSDSSARQIPAEAMTLLRAKIRSEIVELENPIEAVTDTLQEKSKEELIELLKNKK